MIETGRRDEVAIAAGAAVAEVTDRRDSIHVLVDNAGIRRDGQLVKYKDGAVFLGFWRGSFREAWARRGAC